MIYIGDGLTDVPSMALIKKQNGHAVSVYPKNSKVQMKVSNELLSAKRVDFIAEAITPKAVFYTKEYVSLLI